MLKQFADQLSKELELKEPLVTSENGSYSLLLEPALEIILSEHDRNGISLFTKLGLLPENKTDQFLLVLMKANLFGRKTGGNVLGLDKEGKSVTLSVFFPIDRSYKEFHDTLENFANYAESWREEINEFLQQEKL